MTEWNRRKGRVRPYLLTHRWAIPRPSLMWEWMDQTTVLAEVAFGTPSADPILAVGAVLHLPPWVAERLP